LGGRVAWLAAAAALGALTQTGAAGASTDRELLERYRPLLRYDSAEDFHAQPVSLPPDSAETIPADRVYGRIAAEAGEKWLQYWLFYAYNPQDRGIVATGRHEGDWELFQIRLADGGGPDLVTMSQHSWAEGCDWSAVAAGAEESTPVLYVANGSHAMYPQAGNHDRPFPDPTDEADGAGRAVRPPVTVIDDAAPPWVAYSGPWGATEAGFVPGEASSPLGPRFHEGGAWDAPTMYLETVARECGSGAPGRPWAIPALVLAVLALTGLTIAGARSVRRRA
jgi:hypothetical protein